MKIQNSHQKVSVPLLDEVRIEHTNVMTREQWDRL